MASSDILAKLEEVLERQANIEAKLDAMLEGQPEREQTAAAPKRTRTPAVDRVPCTYKKKDGKPCEKPSRPNTEYCAEHPEGMTRAAYKKKMEGTTPSTSNKKESTEPTKMAGPRLTYEKDEANNIQIIKTPSMFKNIVISLEEPYKAYFKRVDDETAHPLTNTEIKQLEKSNIVLAPEDEQNDMLEQLNLTLTKSTGASPAKKPIRIQLSDSEDEDEVKPEPKNKSKVEPKIESKSKPEPKDNSDSEAEVKPEPKIEAKPKVEPKPKIDTKAKKPKSDSESDSDSEEEKKSKRPVRGRKNITVNDDDSD